MKTLYNLSQLDWKLSGWTPYLWVMSSTMEISASPDAEIPAVPARVPGSVQHSLREAGILPDWNVGLNYRECEWVENRHWIYEVAIPDNLLENGKTYRLNCRGLDYCGKIVVNGKVAGEFCGSFTPHVFDITPHLKEKDNVLRIALELSPRWLGQFGYTSKMTEWKVRYNYTWDWTARLVQIGIWDSIYLEATDGSEIRSFRCAADADIVDSTGSIRMWGDIAADDGSRVQVSLTKDGIIIREEEMSASQFNESGLNWEKLGVELWWPNMMGGQPLYTLSCALIDSSGRPVDSIIRRVGFRNISWAQCVGAPEGADPWICVVNGRPVFLQGINWTPILPNFADVTESDYKKRMELYRDLGLNILRVWGGAYLEKSKFYDICDEMGLMVWQEFPLSSSGLDNWPPEDSNAIEEMAEIAESYIARRQHHASLVVWCGGNELCGNKPCDCTHPMLKRQQEVVEKNDPGRRFLPTSSSGPSFGAAIENYGKGVHWDVHGPWKAEGDLEAFWSRYWQGDDALFRSETGAPGASSAEIIRKSAGDLDPMPATADNPLWRRGSSWWVEWNHFVDEKGREPESLEEYVQWSQERQARALSIAAKSCKDRFPRCGGFLVWMGHDSYPCMANTAIIDFEGNPKPAALALREIFRMPQKS